MSTLITVLHVIVCIFLMITVLLQSGKGGMGAAFGGGGTQTVFGGAGAGGFLRKLTVGAAVTFMLTSMVLAWLASRRADDPLRAYSAQQQRAAELKKKARQEALAGEDGGVPTDGGVGFDAPTMSLPGDQPSGEPASDEEPPAIEPNEGEPQTGNSPAAGSPAAGSPAPSNQAQPPGDTLPAGAD